MASVVLFVSVGVLFTALAVPLMLRRVKPNILYGLRTRATLANERVWYEANAKSGRELFVLGVGIGLLALVLQAVPGVTPVTHVLVMAGATGIGASVVAAVGVSRASRLIARHGAEP